ncbi:hypothetical protein D3C80_2198490 [compost metagenome]
MLRLVVSRDTQICRSRLAGHCDGETDAAFAGKPAPTECMVGFEADTRGSTDGPRQPHPDRR